MANIIKILRSLTPGNRPSGRTYGELYVNTADGQLGIVNSSNQNQDLIGVPCFSQGASYQAGAVVYQLGQLYMAITSITPGIFNAAQWSPLTGTQGARYDSGRLMYSSPTALLFYQGSWIKINRILYKIPSSGIAGLANTGIFINGVAGQSLAANSTYYVFAFINSGVITADFCTPGGTTPSTHGPSTTPGNEGVEVRFTSTEDPTRSLIGMIHTSNTTGTFNDDNRSFVGVASWYNRRPRFIYGNYMGAIPGIGSTTTITYPGYNFGCLNWGDVQPWTYCNVLLQNDQGSGPGGATYFQLYLDNNTSEPLFSPVPRCSGNGSGYESISAIGGANPAAGAALNSITEGWHTYVPGLWVSAPTGYCNPIYGGVFYI